jgi:uncharacterized protein YndB with AHSA1/START domain
MIEMREMGAAVPPVVRGVHVARPVEDAFRVFTERIGDWWPLARFGLYGATTAGVRFEGGAVIERSTSGDQGVWAEVLEWSPPHRLVLSWHPGHRPEEATRVEVDFTIDEDGTAVVLTHHGWEVLDDRAAEAAATYGSGWVSVLAGFASVAGSQG